MSMWKKLKQKFKKKDSSYSNKGLSVKIGSPFSSKFVKINKYIKDRIHNFKLESLAFLDNYDVKSKLWLIFTWIINIFATGFAIQYSLENRNALSYGLITVLFTYYLDKVVVIIKQPIKESTE